MSICVRSSYKPLNPIDHGWETDGVHIPVWYTSSQLLRLAELRASKKEAIKP